MRPRPPLAFPAGILLAALGLAAAPGRGAPDPSSAMPAHAPTVTRVDYRGWTDSLRLANGLVEAIVVPAVGRIMEFRFAGAADGPFWVNPDLNGRAAAASGPAWANYGGEKAWPAPQSDWPHHAGHGWPPPAVFDGAPMQAAVEGGAVILTSAVDPGYGIRVRRRIELASDRPELIVRTAFEKSAGAPVEVAVWSIAQLREPVAVYLPRPTRPSAAAPYLNQLPGLPAGLRVRDGWVSLVRDRTANRKIGAAAGALVWVGGSEILSIESALVPGARYPDGGASVEVYTNADPQAYVELELLGPLVRLAPGETAERTATFTLAHRSERDPDAEFARLALAPAAR